MTERKNVAASVKQRLMNISRQRGDNFNILLVRYGIERLLFRLGRSAHGANFVLKGAMLFHLWTARSHRPTRDVDLLGTGSPNLDRLRDVFRTVCAAPFDDDGLEFQAESVMAERIKEDADYEGVRITLSARLGSARIALQVDVGFGDAVVPPPEVAEIPTLLDHPRPRLQVYWRSTVVAEKLQALVDLGLANSRMKDFYDLLFLSKTFDFNGRELTRSVAATFSRRSTTIPRGVPTGLTDEFADDQAKVIQWRAFLRRAQLDREEIDLKPVVVGLRRFLVPILESIVAGSDFDEVWPAGGPWVVAGSM